MKKHRVRFAIALAMLISLAGSWSPLVRVSTAKPKAETARFDSSAGEMREQLESYNVDRGSLARTYPDSLSPTRRARFKQFYGPGLN